MNPQQQMEMMMFFYFFALGFATRSLFGCQGPYRDVWRGGQIDTWLQAAARRAYDSRATLRAFSRRAQRVFTMAALKLRRGGGMQPGPYLGATARIEMCGVAVK